MFAEEAYVIMVFRTLFGVSQGVSMCFHSLFVLEISPLNLRGKL